MAIAGVLNRYDSRPRPTVSTFSKDAVAVLTVLQRVHRPRNGEEKSDFKEAIFLSIFL